MIWLISCLVLLLLLSWVLVAPIQLNIDTNRHLYRVRWVGIAQAGLRLIDQELVIQLWVFFWKKNFYPLRSHPKKKKPVTKTKEKKTSTVWGWQKWKKRILRVLRSFEVRSFRLHLDTDDYARNAYLYPAFYFLRGKGRDLQINFNGHSELVFIAENRLFRILTAMFL